MTRPLFAAALCLLSTACLVAGVALLAGGGAALVCGGVIGLGFGIALAVDSDETGQVDSIDDEDGDQ